MNVDELYKLLAGLHFLKGEYNDVLSIMVKFPESEQTSKPYTECSVFTH